MSSASGILLENLLSHGQTAGGDDNVRREVRATQALIAGGGGLYFVWHPLALLIDPKVYDPLWLRAAMAGLCFLTAALLYLPSVVKWRGNLLVALFALATMHVSYLTAQNDFSHFYFVSVLVCVACCGVVITKMSSFFVYSAIICAWGSLLALMDDVSMGRQYLQVGAGVATLQIVTALSLWRRLRAEDVARQNLQQARDFLHKVIDAVPDPVFVRDSASGGLMVNEAFRRHTVQEATSAIARSASELSAVNPDEPPKTMRVSSGAGGDWVEQDLDVVLEGVLKQSVATKVAKAALLSGREFEVGVVRDVTERKQLEAALEAKVRELQSTQKHVRRLEGLLPICMHCGRIRENDNKWQELATFIEKNSDASFSHVLCHDCLDEHHPAAGEG